MVNSIISNFRRPLHEFISTWIGACPKGILLEDKARKRGSASFGGSALKKNTNDFILHKFAFKNKRRRLNSVTV